MIARLLEQRRLLRHAQRALTIMLALCMTFVLQACSISHYATDGKLRIVTTTGIIKDLVQNVTGDLAHVTAIVPDNADPHSYEPSLRKIRDIVYADVAFSNYVMLEEHGIIKALDANLRPNIPNVALAEESVKHAAEVIPLVENVSLDTVWLGLAVQGSGSNLGAKRTSQVRLRATSVTGPGNLWAYLTGSFGNVDIYFNSADGIDEDDAVSLPTNAHTHLSWAFDKPGIYTLTLQGTLQIGDGSPDVDLGHTTMMFAVGVNALEKAQQFHREHLLDAGHADLAIDVDKKGFVYRQDEKRTSRDQVLSRKYFPTSSVLIDVPTKALHEIPPGRSFHFLGKARNKIFVLPQAVLGKHVHGEIDPHLWQNIRNAIAYVRTIEDTVVKADPQHAQTYHDRANDYVAKLSAANDYVSSTIASIPQERRLLITTHDAFSYLAAAYHVKIAGFVTPNPATEPSLSDRKKLVQTLQDLKVKAVFLEPNLKARSSVLQEVAKEQHVRICPIYGDTFDGKVNTYIDMMRFNANSLKECLT